QVGDRTPGAFSWGAPHDGGASGSICNEDDFIGIDQGSEDGMGPGEDRFCGTKLHERDVLISRSKPFMLRVKSNHDALLNGNNSQYGFSLRYTQLPCMI
ncbi:CUB domain-containing protein, partial [Caerostris extrusa]